MLRFALLAILTLSALGIYLYRVDPFHTYERAITANETVKGDWFGSSLALHKGTAVVSAFYADTYGERSGAAYSVENVDSMTAIDGPALLRPLAIEGLEAGDEGGFSTAMTEHVLVIGAISGFASPPGERTSGRVLLFYRASLAAPWKQMATLRAPNPEAGDYFGYSVALGKRWLVVGAKHDDEAGVNAGAAFVYELAVDGAELAVSLSETLTPDAGSDGIEFGTHVAVDDADTRRPARIAVGAPYADRSAADAGAAYLFTLVDGVWQRQALLTVDGLDPDAHLGIGVALEGDTVVVGASHWADDGRRGAVHVFTEQDEQWRLTQTLMADDGLSGDMLGMRVDISGQRIVAGAHLADTVAANAGAVYLFQRSCEGWRQTRKLIPLDAKRDDNFGIALDLDDDRLLVGSELADVVGADSGAVYLYRLESDLDDLSTCKL